jgi:hypothetical protein
MNTFLQFYSPTNPLSIDNYGIEPYSEDNAAIVKGTEEIEDACNDFLRPELNQYEIKVLADKISDKLVEIVQKQLATA